VHFKFIDKDVLNCASNTGIYTWLQEKGILTKDTVTISDERTKEKILGICPCLIDNILVILDSLEDKKLSKIIEDPYVKDVIIALVTASRLLVYAKQD